MSGQADYIRWFADIGGDDLALVGGKNASLGEMYGALTGVGLRVPNGFALTTDLYRETLAGAATSQSLRQLLNGLDIGDVAALQHCGAACRALIYDAPMPDGAHDQILSAFARLQDEYGGELRVAVRSSATAEDLPHASFAGQHDSYLNIAGGEALIEACKRCLASVFTDRAIRYRTDHGFGQLDVALSVGIMKMVRADQASSGVLFTLDTESGFRDVVLINAAYGLGENIVQGTVDPDEFYVHKPTFRLGHRCVLRRNLGAKQMRMVSGSRRGGGSTLNVPTSESERARFALNDDEVMALTDYALKIEDHYSVLAGKPMPMDVEWAKDESDGELYIVQARPETVASRANPNELVRYSLAGSGELLAEGRAVGASVASGVARVVHDPADLTDFEVGDVLVADTTAPDWGAVIKKAAAVVTNRGGRTCHAAIVARELGIPAVVGTGDATEQIEAGQVVTVSCAHGEAGKVLLGAVPFETVTTDLGDLPRTATRMMLNVGNPDIAFKTAMLPNDGVGLARLEFIINEYVHAHPMALLYPERVEDDAERRQLVELTRDFQDPRDFFVARLSEGVGTIAAAFYPNPVVVRLSDFKTNEYADLLGGRAFEPVEENPMLGFRGASRYAHPAYREGFALECAAMRRVRHDMGLRNVRIMIPFCRRVEEAKSVLALMAEHGLQRGEDGLQIYVMCEIPNNVILIDEFAEHFDGFSIGSNDLTQLTLGVDRDSELVAFDFDERDPGVLKMLELAVAGAKRNGRHSGICGQAPSDYPEVAEFLVRLGIDSLSLNPDSLLATTRLVAGVEAAIREEGASGAPPADTAGPGP
ncbi:MAG: phosphoenolpyruvate synthase [Gammaproteobacteria bacterium]|nr:phosphoenolpyruvate synthase [Gammaproteobacteria bacterium]